MYQVESEEKVKVRINTEGHATWGENENTQEIKRW